MWVERFAINGLNWVTQYERRREYLARGLIALKMQPFYRLMV